MVLGLASSCFHHTIPSVLLCQDAALPKASLSKQLIRTPPIDEVPIVRLDVSKLAGVEPLRLLLLLRRRSSILADQRRSRLE